MEEADLLSTRVAIISKRILAVGTTDFLRQKHGAVYHVHLMLTSAPTSSREEMAAVEHWIESAFTGVSFDPFGNNHGQVRFSVPSVRVPQDNIEDRIAEVGSDGASGKQSGVGALFALLEGSKETMGLRSYSVRATTMGEVFLKVIRDNNVQEEGVVSNVGRRWSLWKLASWKCW